ncbi:uncharacterized protein B0H18DRAFT_976449, partial [Fomitopsis serialis]|uniref:uncharacterized protein n=1 Tax=Fomitopsis serialis TaxID=139415 RepID=UPI0020085B8D
MGMLFPEAPIFDELVRQSFLLLSLRCLTRHGARYGGSRGEWRRARWGLRHSMRCATRRRHNVSNG